MNILHTLGLMKRSEHERLMDYSVSFHHKRFKRAATDLAAQAEEIAALSEELATMEAELADLRPDAEAMRKKRAADRARRKGAK